MHEKLQNDIPLKEDIHGLMRQCLKTEKDLGLAEKTIKELSRYLNEFVIYCKNQSIHTVEGLTPDFLKSYAEKRSATGGPKLKKAVVWSLRKFGKHLALLQALNENPARNLRHPTFHPRAEVPEYLSEQELHRVLTYAAHNLTIRDFAIISLLSSTGLRPNEIATCTISDFLPKQGTLYLHVKGGWTKETPLSETMTALLMKYLATRHDKCRALFVNKRGRSISVDWVQRMVKTTGKKTGLTFTCNHLRHTFATFAAETSGKVITKALMGHQRLATTEVYTHLSPHYFKSCMMLHPYLKATKKGAFHEHR